MKKIKSYRISEEVLTMVSEIKKGMPVEVSDAAIVEAAIKKMYAELNNKTAK